MAVVNEQEQAKRAVGMVTTAYGIVLSIPVLGDLIGAVFVAAPLAGQVFVKSATPWTDLLKLLALCAAFFFSLGLLIIFDKTWGSGFPLAMMARFFIATRGMAYFARRLDQGTV